MLTTCDLCHAGYATYISPQIPEFWTVNGPSGQEQIPNPEGAVLHPDHYCGPVNFSRFAPEDARRTEVIRSDAGTMTAAQVLAICPTVMDAKYKSLWDAASAWEQKYISGVALSLLTLGVLQNKPKSLAIAAWSNNLWNGIYYPRKALVNLDSDPDCNFSPAGDMPYSVPELSAEVWGK